MQTTKGVHPNVHRHDRGTRAIAGGDFFSNFFLSAGGIAPLGSRGPLMTIFCQSSVNLQLGVGDRSKGSDK